MTAFNIKFLSLFILITCALSAADAQGSLELHDVSLTGMNALPWREVAPGVWSAQIGAKQALTYMDFAGAAPQTEALAKMPTAKFPFNENDTRGLLSNQRSIARIPLDDSEQLYGLGLQFQGLNRRGKVYHLRMDHYKSGNERLHAPAPFYVSSNGYGVLFNSAQYISIYAGVGNRKDSPNFPAPRDRNTDRSWQAMPDSDAVEASVIADGMEVIVFAGPSMLDAVRRYNLYAGGGALPPKWGLGFWHRMRTNASSDDVLDEVGEFERRGFPLDVIGLEPGWHTKSYPCTYEWNPALFPAPETFMQEMTKQGVHVNLWENPYVSPDAPIYLKIKPFTGSHTVWLGIVPDFILPQARNIFSTYHESEHLSLGVSGYKFDEVDGYDFWLWPDHAMFPSGTSAEQMRQLYGLQIQKMMMETFRKRNQRTYSLVRASNAAASSYPFAIYTDHYDHKGFINALINTSFSGLLYTPEIRSAKSPEEWLRRMQSVCFSHMVQLNGWSSNTKPWTFAEVEDDVRKIIQLRTRLLPYIYTAFAKYHFDGTPPIRSMVLEPGYNDQQTVSEGVLDDAKNPYAMAVRKDVTDQYMFGEAILVAPMLTGQTQRSVILPQGKWYDFYTGDYAGGGEVITVEAPLDTIPLYVKDGGIIPMTPVVERISKAPNEIEIEVRHYGESSSSAMLYDDDGTTFDFESGDYVWKQLTAKNMNGKRSGDVTTLNGEYESSYTNFEWVFMTNEY
ncbi:MAG: glycoside hydrolase family 31 protein [Candidatus Hinthialibacter antarcticus]|nr:glycoside hydrolase family 31 protein [Candidatus Hinthialibacter antarcticus]